MSIFGDKANLEFQEGKSFQKPIYINNFGLQIPSYKKKKIVHYVVDKLASMTDSCHDNESTCLYKPFLLEKVNL